LQSYSKQKATFQQIVAGVSLFWSPNADPATLAPARDDAASLKRRSLLRDNSMVRCQNVPFLIELPKFFQRRVSMETASIDILSAQVSHLRDRIDSLAEETQSAKKPWFKNVSTLISVAAFLFSFGTTIVSYRRTTEQDIHNLRSELRVLLQRLAALPRENVEITQKYVAEPSIVAVLSGYVNQENLLLSRQADEAIKRLPRDQVSATDYLAVALALEQSRNFDSAIENFNNALSAATILDDEVAALRLLGSLEMMAGKSGQARSHFQQALDIFGKYRTYDDLTKLNTNFLTEMTWAGAEANSHNLDIAQQHLNKADQITDSLPKGLQTDMYKAQIAQFKNGLQGTALPNAPPVSVNVPPNVFGTAPLGVAKPTR
jgi:tetratricopeptide (TPR) repeat protein